MLAQTDTFGAATAALTALVAIALPLSVGVAKVVDFIRNLFGDNQPNIPSWVWNVVAFVVGVAAAVGWGINLLSAVVATVPALADKAGTNDTLGQILTGLILGGMAGFWHDKMAQWAAAHKAPPTT
jgi:hypothetical protein